LWWLDGGLGVRGVGYLGGELGWGWCLDSHLRVLLWCLGFCGVVWVLGVCLLWRAWMLCDRVGFWLFLDVVVFFVLFFLLGGLGGVFLGV